MIGTEIAEEPRVVSLDLSNDKRNALLMARGAQAMQIVPPAGDYHSLIPKHKCEKRVAV